MPQVGFEPTISAGERPQTCALDRAATGTGTKVFLILDNAPGHPQSLVSPIRICNLIVFLTHPTNIQALYTRRTFRSIQAESGKETVVGVGKYWVETLQQYKCGVDGRK